jgi:hypothetical protein
LVLHRKKQISDQRAKRYQFSTCLLLTFN